ncbi:MAG: amino acid decarboxylase [Saprospiraceae bacterium]|nr:amino acid decarboxylase [Saprospiraceae bacterium]
MKIFETLAYEETLDPEDWKVVRQLAHTMVDDMFDYLENVKNRPVWTPITEGAKNALNQPLPIEPMMPEHVYEEFKAHILPFNMGNVHPRFWSWVNGNGTAMGMMADMLASGMNPNNTIGEHAGQYVERQVITWLKAMFNYPSVGSGLLVSGGSVANITAIIVARNHFDQQIRNAGNAAVGGLLTMYCSSETHNCMMKAADVIGVGSDNLRKIPVDSDFQINVVALEQAILEDKKAGKVPFCIVGNAGTVNTGAIDPLSTLQNLATEYGLWFHVDGAFGALAKLDAAFGERLKAIETADSVAFDLHKWMYMNYEVGCVLVRDENIHRSAFAQAASYLAHHERGLASGIEPRSNFGLELSRNFKALKVWMLLKEHGIEKYRRLIRQNIAQIKYLSELIDNQMFLERLSEPVMNVLCFRFNPKNMSDEHLNMLNKEILMRLHEHGIAAPSYGLLNGKYAIRVANVNHRSRKEDFEALVEGVVKLGQELI